MKFKFSNKSGTEKRIRPVSSGSKLCLAAGIPLLCVSLPLNAGILIVSPEDGSTVSLHNDYQKKFLTMDSGARKKYFSDQTFRDSLHQAGHWPQPVTFRWMVSSRTKGPYTLRLMEEKSACPVAQHTVEGTEFSVENLKIATRYNWTIEAASGEKCSASFQTSNQPPRMMKVDGVPNFRDLGGRVGINGRRIRQGILFRSAGLNDNAEPICEFSRQKLESEGGWRKKLYDWYTADLNELKKRSNASVVSWTPCGEWTFLATEKQLSYETTLEWLEKGAEDKFVSAGEKDGKIILPSPQIRRMAVLKRDFDCQDDGFRTISCSADWFWVLIVNGKIVFDCQDGSQGHPGIDNYVFDIPVKRGRNSLVVLLGSGLGGWRWYFNEPGSVPEPERNQCRRKMLEKKIQDFSIVVTGYTPGKSRVSGASGDYLRNVLKIRSDIDLRNDAECAGMQGSPLGKSVQWFHYSSGSYHMIDNQTWKKAFARVFRVLLEPKNYPAVFHCISGQDRTGCLAFTLCALLGVDENQLYLDWETTGFWNPESRISHRLCIDGYVKHLMELPGDNFCQKTEYYVKSCGFTDQEIEKFRNWMLEPEEQRKH